MKKQRCCNNCLWFYYIRVIISKQNKWNVYLFCFLDNSNLKLYFVFFFLCQFQKPPWYATRVYKSVYIREHRRPGRRRETVGVLKRKKNIEKSENKRKPKSKKWKIRQSDYCKSTRVPRWIENRAPRGGPPRVILSSTIIIVHFAYQQPCPAYNPPTPYNQQHKHTYVISS